ncbi:MAG: T9SS type A sorting domain-containing protein [bacterium]
MKYENDTLKHLIAPEHKSDITTNNDNIIKLSSLNSLAKGSFPVIYRTISRFDLKNPPLETEILGKKYWISNRQEKVFWSVFYSPDSMDYISGINIYHRDCSENFMEIMLTVYSFIISLELDLFQPNISQNLFLYFPEYDKSLEWYNLNIGTSSGIYQLNFNKSLINDIYLSLDWVNPSIMEKITNEGELPHLSKNSKSNPISDIWSNDASLWKNRSIFNSETGSPPDILTSAKSFYRQSDDEILTEGYAGYCSNTFYYYVGEAFLDGNHISWRLPFEEIEDTIINEKYYVPIIRDSIYTPMFNVAPSTTADLDFTVFALSSESATIGLEGHPSNTFMALPIPVSTTDSTGTLMQFTFINMADLDYRVIFINHDTTAEYSERLFIGGLPIADTVMAKRAANYGGRIIIDLETGQIRKLTEAGKMELKVFPNPAKDEVFVTVNYPVKYILENSDNINKAKIRLYSITGEKLFEVLARPGETIKIPTSEFTQGLYFIQAEENIDKWQLDYLAPVVERVSIAR